MSIKRLAIRTKKSLSGLYSSGHTNSCSPLSANCRLEASQLTGYRPQTPGKSCVPVNENHSPVLDDLGLSSSCPSSPSTPGKNSPSPSRRKRLIDSLRKVRSGSNSPVNQLKNGPPAPPETPTKLTRPSLALNFEVSPPGQPMFEPNRNLSSSSSVDVNHSSPITVPTSSKQNIPLPSTPPSAKFEVGSVPDTPAPLNSRYVQECILNHSISMIQGLPEKTDGGDPLGADPNPTPMPGTNLPLEDIDTPSIVITRPQLAGRVNEVTYFSMPVASMERHSDPSSSVPASVEASCSSESNPPIELNTDTTVESEHKLDPKAFPEPDLAPDSLPVETPMAGPNGMPHNTVDKPGIIPSQLYTLPKLDSDSYILDEEARLSLEEKSKLSDAYLAKFADEGWKQLSDRQQRRQSTWSRHTGLYDGTGYGEVAPANLHDLNATAGKRANSATDTSHETLVESISTFQATIECEKDISVSSQGPAASDVRLPMNEGAALQEIIRVYAHPTLDQPMIDLEEAREQQTSAQMQDSTAEEDTMAYEEKMEIDMKTSARVMNSSLGG